MITVYCVWWDSTHNYFQIPIHIAITRDNMFLPLKDGISSAEHDHLLLGAEVSQIVDTLSLGWYESIFQSYMAQKVRNFHLVIFCCSDLYLASESCFFCKVLHFWKIVTYLWKRWENNLLVKVLPWTTLQTLHLLEVQWGQLVNISLACLACWSNLYCRGSVVVSDSNQRLSCCCSGFWRFEYYY